MTPRHGLLRPAAAVLAVLFAAAAAFAQGTVYNSVPSPLAPNYVSLGFQATQTAEFGDFVHLGGTTRALNTVTITMSNWALQSTPGNVTYCANNPSLCDSTGFLHPFKLTIYNIGAGTAGTRGALDRLSRPSHKLSGFHGVPPPIRPVPAERLGDLPQITLATTATRSICHLI